MKSIGCIAFSEAYSIDLYAINLKKKNVPERPTQVSRKNYHVRRLISARVTLRASCCNPEAEPIKKVSSHLMEQHRIFDLMVGHPAAEMM
ncbi:Uncharacterised protein [uncultured archaeon]|nr:Uncharacterised protein [uncultured archaeon]